MHCFFLCNWFLLKVSPQTPERLGGAPAPLTPVHRRRHQSFNPLTVAGVVSSPSIMHLKCKKAHIYVHLFLLRATFLSSRNFLLISQKWKLHKCSAPYQLFNHKSFCQCFYLSIIPKHIFVIILFLRSYISVFFAGRQRNNHQHLWFSGITDAYNIQDSVRVNHEIIK